MPPRPTRLRVLVVDDVPENRDVVVDLLSLYGITHVAVASDAATGRQQMAAYHPDVAVIDVAMPTEDGTALAAWVRKEYPAVRVVMYSAFQNVGWLALAVKAAGAVAFLQKPFDADDLYTAVTGERPEHPACR